jgi:hypothetical protein
MNEHSKVFPKGKVKGMLYTLEVLEEAGGSPALQQPWLPASGPAPPPFCFPTFGGPEANGSGIGKPMTHLKQSQ